MSRYIDADALIKKLTYDIVCLTKDGEECKQCIIDHIGKEWYAPTANVVEVRHGHWEEENRLRRSAKFLCSVCGGLAYFVQPTRDETWKKCCPYKYCPNCGAKMDGERREENEG
jgi:ribosomal protein L33